MLHYTYFIAHSARSIYTYTFAVSLSIPNARMKFHVELLRTFENRLLRTLGSTSNLEEAPGSWKKLHNEELHNFGFSIHIIRMVKFRRMR
jgi:hypothetical protein